MLTMLAVILMAVGLRGFAGRIAIFLGLIFGYAVSWLADQVFGQITSVTPSSGRRGDRPRPGGLGPGQERLAGSGSRARPPTAWTGNQAQLGNLDAVGWHLPSFSVTFALLVHACRDRPRGREHRARQGGLRA